MVNKKYLNQIINSFINIILLISVSTYMLQDAVAFGYGQSNEETYVNVAGTFINPNGRTIYKAGIESRDSSYSKNSKNLVRFKNTAMGEHTEKVVEGVVDVKEGITHQGLKDPITESIQANNFSYYQKQSGFTTEAAAFGGIVASIATMGSASCIGMLATSAAGLQGTALGVGLQNATAVAVTSTASGIASNALLKKNLKKGAKATFESDGLKAIAASTLSAGATGVASTNLGIKINDLTIHPVSTTDITHRATYAGINTASQTAVGVALLDQKLGSSLVDNLQANVTTQAQAIGATHLGAAYASGDINYTEHKLAHAALGGITGAAAGGKPLAGATGALTAEVTGEAAFNAGINPTDSSNLAKVAGSAAGLASGDVVTGYNTSTTAVENNFVQFAAAAARTCAANPACASLVRDGMAVGLAMAITMQDGMIKGMEGFDITDIKNKLPGFNPEESKPSVLTTPEADQHDTALATPLPGPEAQTKSEGLAAAPDWANRFGDMLFNEEASTVLIRPTAKQSELDVGKNLGGASDYQKSYKGGEVVKYGTKGSVRPDHCIGNICSIEVKNYDINKNSTKLVDNVVKQALQRKVELAPGMVQKVVIDVRGQNYNENQLRVVSDKIQERTNGLVNRNNIEFITSDKSKK